MLRKTDGAEEIVGIVLSKQRTCQWIGQNRRSQRHVGKRLPDEDELPEEIVEHSRAYKRYGHRMIAV